MRPETKQFLIERTDRVQKLGGKFHCWNGKTWPFPEYSQEHIVYILMERDEVSEQDALDSINACVEALQDVIADGDIFSGQDIIQDTLGLEPDYLEALVPLM